MEEEEQDEVNKDTENAPKHEEEELQKDQEDANNEFNTTYLDHQIEIPSWLEQQLKTKAPLPPNPKDCVEEILDQAQVKTQDKMKPKVISHITIDMLGSWILQVATPLVDKDVEKIQARDYQVMTINIGPASKAQKIGEFQGSITTIL